MQHRVATIKGFFAWCFDMEYITVNPSPIFPRIYARHNIALKSYATILHVSCISGTSRMRT